MLQCQAEKAKNRIECNCTALKNIIIISLHNDEDWKKKQQEILTCKDEWGRVMTSRFITAPQDLIIFIPCIKFTLCCYSTI